MNHTTRAQRAKVEFFEGLSVDGYLMPDGSYRFSLSGASQVLGYPANWLSRSMGRGGTLLKALQGEGFGGEVIETGTLAKGTPAKTISLDDFVLLVPYAANQGKKAAWALQKALVRMSLMDFCRDAFGENPLSIAEKRRQFYESYAKSISPEGWLYMDRAEILDLALLGDEPHMAGGLWNEGSQWLT